jgi:hypothetical protein
LEAQYLGGRALLIPKTAEQFELTAEQKEKLEPIQKEFVLTGQAGAPRLTDEAASVRLEKYKSDLLAVLTPEQTNRWQAMTGAPFTAPKSFSGPSWRLVLVSEVQKELGLSEDDATTLVQSLAAIRKEEFEERSSTLRPNRAGRPRDDGIRQSQKVIDTVGKSLTVSQWNRLQELVLQDQGVEALAHHEVAKNLGLSQEQQDRVRKAIDVYRRGNLEEYRLGLLVNTKELRTRHEKEQADLLDVLTEDQKEQWKAIQGARVDLDLLRRPRISPVRE